MSMNGRRYDDRRPRDRRQNGRRTGMYLALAVCLVAVGVAAWSTFDAVSTYNTANESAASRLAAGGTSSLRSDDPLPYSSRGQTTPAPSISAAPGERTGSGTEGTASGTSRADRLASEGSAPAGTPAPEVTTPARQTAADVTEEPEEEEEAPKIPANAPMYEISSQMILPLSGEEVQEAYSAGAPVYSPTMKDWRIHAGADLTAQAGEEVRACANGQVKQTYVDRMLGNVILIEHGDYLFSYCGVSENFLVHEGDVVTKGQVIGTVTAVPFEAAQEPHLHLEVRRDGVPMDPLAVIRG